MHRRVAALFVIAILAASAAQAQVGGGGGSGGGRHGGRGGGGGGSTSSTTRSDTAPTHTEKPANEIDIIGVITAIDLASERITIAYQAVDALDLPAGSRPFPVSKTALLKAATVGEKVRFRLDSQQISELRPF